MITIRQNTAWGLPSASRILLLCIIHPSYAATAEPRPAKIAIADARNTGFARLTTKAGFREDRQGRTDPPSREFQDSHDEAGHTLVGDLKFTHLTTNDGLSQSAVTAISQDRRGFMWFGTRDGLNRYDGNDFVVYKNKAEDRESLSANLITDLMEDDQGYLWIATYTGGVNQIRSRNRTLHALSSRPRQSQQSHIRFGQQYRPGQARFSVVWHRSKRPGQV